MTTHSRAANLLRLSTSLTRLGLSTDETLALLKIERTLSRWSTAECNGEIERDETTDKPVAVSRSYTQGNGPRVTWPIADREAGALKRLAAILAPHKRRLWFYHQGDPRGCSLYVGRKSALPKMDAATIARLEGERAALSPASRLRATVRQYYTHGVAVCV